MREHFRGLVSTVLGTVDTDPKRFFDAISRSASELRHGRNPLDDGGLAAVFASAEQREALDHMSGLMSLLEGHGDVTMDRAGADQIPSAERFTRVLRQRRQQGNPALRMLQRLIGLEAKLKQYEQGERFIERVEGVGGPELLNRVWESPLLLPSMQEIRDPDAWVARVRSAAALSA
jgi:putative hydrolase